MGAAPDLHDLLPRSRAHEVLGTTSSPGNTMALRFGASESLVTAEVRIYCYWLLCYTTLAFAHRALAHLLSHSIAKDACLRQQPTALDDFTHRG